MKDAVAALLDEIAASGQGSFLAVLKTWGRAFSGMLSFPLEGRRWRSTFPTGERRRSSSFRGSTPLSAKPRVGFTRRKTEDTKGHVGRGLSAAGALSRLADPAFRVRFLEAYRTMSSNKDKAQAQGRSFWGPCPRLPRRRRGSGRSRRPSSACRAQASRLDADCRRPAPARCRRSRPLRLDLADSRAPQARSRKWRKGWAARIPCCLPTVCLATRRGRNQARRSPEDFHRQFHKRRRRGA